PGPRSARGPPAWRGRGRSSAPRPGGGEGRPCCGSRGRWCRRRPSPRGPLPRPWRRKSPWRRRPAKPPPGFAHASPPGPFPSSPPVRKLNDHSPRYPGRGSGVKPIPPLLGLIHRTPRGRPSTLLLILPLSPHAPRASFSGLSLPKLFSRLFQKRIARHIQNKTRETLVLSMHFDQHVSKLLRIRGTGAIAGRRRQSLVLPEPKHNIHPRASSSVITRIQCLQLVLRCLPKIRIPLSLDLQMYNHFSAPDDNVRSLLSGHAC